jgi:hypothetical protein
MSKTPHCSKSTAAQSTHFHALQAGFSKDTRQVGSQSGQTQMKQRIGLSRTSPVIRHIYISISASCPTRNKTEPFFLCTNWHRLHIRETLRCIAVGFQRLWQEVRLVNVWPHTGTPRLDWEGLVHWVCAVVVSLCVVPEIAAARILPLSIKPKHSQHPSHNCFQFCLRLPSLHSKMQDRLPSLLRNQVREVHKIP